MGSLVAAYNVDDRARTTTLGTAGRVYDGVYSAMGIHQFMFTLVDSPDETEPLYIATFEWAPRNAASGRSRRRD